MGQPIATMGTYPVIKRFTRWLGTGVVHKSYLPVWLGLVANMKEELTAELKLHMMQLGTVQKRVKPIGLAAPQVSR